MLSARSVVRALLVLVLAVGLVALFLANVDLAAVAHAIVHASWWWIAVAVATMPLNLALRAWRWQLLLQPVGRPPFWLAFRATAVGFAASTVLPARAGEVIRPYFLSRQHSVSATGAFATVIIERVLDVAAVLALLAIYVLAVPAPPGAEAHPLALATITWAGVSAAVVAFGALIVMAVVASRPDQITTLLGRVEQRLPSRLAGLLEGIAEKFVRGLGVVRHPSLFLLAVAASIPLWLSIAAGTYAVSQAFGLPVPFTGTWLVVAVLVVGVAVPTPGAVGGFHAAYRYAATTFFAAPDGAAVGAAIVLHLISVGPTLVLGLLFAAHEGLNVAAMRQMAEASETQGRDA